MKYKKIFIADGSVDRIILSPEYKTGAFFFKEPLYDFYFFNGKLHRDDGPAAIDYWNRRSKKYKISAFRYYLNGLKHRDDGPAETRYDEKGNLLLHKYWKYGKLHCENGPAKIIYGGNIYGIHGRTEYYLNGTSHSKEEYEERLATKLYW